MQMILVQSTDSLIHELTGSPKKPKATTHRAARLFHPQAMNKAWKRSKGS